MYGYYLNGELIGYYSLRIQDNQECELNNLCVLPQHRHRKIGCQLLENAFENARNMNCTIMHSSTDTDIAYLPAEPVHFHKIPYIILIFKEHEYTRHNIPNQALCSKTDDQSQNSDTGYNGTDICP